MSTTRTIDHEVPLEFPAVFPPVPKIIPRVVGSRRIDRSWIAKNLGTARRRRLFAVQFALRRLPAFESDYPGDAWPRAAIRMAERFADGLVSEVEIDSGDFADFMDSTRLFSIDTLRGNDAQDTENNSRLLTLALPCYRWAPEWLTGDSREIAESIYWERRWDRMPILADALENAGCDLQDLLEWMRCPDVPWYRGSWIVDKVIQEIPESP